MTKIEKIFYIFLITLAVFTFGVQIGIYHGRKLQRHECWRHERMQEYLFKKIAECGVNNDY